MRTETTWEEKAKRWYIQKLPPRLQQDVQTIPEPNFPDPENIESCFIFGETDTGKTVLACFYMLQEQKNIYLNGGPVDDSDTCVFITMTELINQIKNTFNRESSSVETEQKLLLYYGNVHMLVLDDFGTVKPTDWVLQILYTIINHRYDHLKKTIITSNNSLEEIAEVMEDDRITSRIERMCKLIKKKPYER